MLRSEGLVDLWEDRTPLWKDAAAVVCRRFPESAVVLLIGGAPGLAVRLIVGGTGIADLVDLAFHLWAVAALFFLWEGPAPVAAACGKAMVEFPGLVTRVRRAAIRDVAGAVMAALLAGLALHLLVSLSLGFLVRSGAGVWHWAAYAWVVRFGYGLGMAFGLAYGLSAAQKPDQDPG